MVVGVICMFVLLIFSLINYLNDEEFREFRQQTASMIYQNKNSTHDYSKRHIKLIVIQSSVVLVVFGLIALISFGKLVVDNLDFQAPLEEFNKKLAARKFALSEDKTEFPPAAFNHNGNNGDNMPVAQKGAEEPSENSKLTSNQTQTEPEKKIKRKEDETAKEFEQRLYAETGEQAKRDEIKRKAEERKKQREIEKSRQKVVGGNGGTVNTNSSTDGDVDGAFDLGGRSLKENDKSNLKIPSYTCPNSGDIKVVVTVRVGFDGLVKSANTVRTDLPSCVKEKAEEYALRSKFESSSKSLETGTITYTFRSR